ncbi:MAG: hypothetical protein ABSC56_05190 [Solirubrobacteraceae bacterium]|jgi:hypothetical protein
MDDRERQLEIEGAQRRRVAALAILAGVLYLIGQILVEVLVTSKSPSIGLLQGLAPALQHGAKAAAVDPRLADARFLDKHAVTDLVGWILSGIALVAMSWPLGYLRDAAVARGAPPSRVSHVLSRYAAPFLGVISVAFAISDVIGAHQFLHDAVQNTAAYNASVGGTLRDVLELLYLVGYLSLAIGFVLVALRAMRVGLVTRALGIIGIVGGVLFVIPIVPIPVVQFLFLGGVGLTLLEVAGMVLPPAWAAGEAIPWAPQQPRQRGGQRSPRREPRGSLAPVPTPPPAPSRSASKKRKRRRG